MNDSPRIELVRLSWRMSDAADTGSKPAANAAPGAVPGAGAAAVWLILDVDAQLPLVLVSDQRAQIDLIEGFATRLRDPKTQVRVLSRPFDIESDKPLKSASDASRAQPADVPKFSVRIVRQL
jgi:hypothetical protein